MDTASSSPISKKPRLSSCLPTKVCLICYSDGDYQAYIVDYDADGDGDSEFVKRRPNIRFRNFGPSCFCMVDSTIYIFLNPRPGDAYSSMLVYSYKPLPEASDVTLDADSSLSAIAGTTLCPKIHPSAVRHGLKILVFSTLIYVGMYEGDDYGDSRTDFEIYDTKNNTVEALPKLSLREADSVLQFFDIETKTWKPIYRSRGFGFGGRKLEIEGFSVVNDRTFVVVLPDLNRMFCLDLVCPFENGFENGWRLYEGVAILGHHQTFVTESGFNVDDSGVYRTTQAANEDLAGLIRMEGMGCNKAKAYFPRPSFDKIFRSGSCGNSMGTFVEGDPQLHGGTVFVAETRFDVNNIGYPCWIVDKLVLDFDRLPAGDLIRVVDDEWAKRVASHKSVGEEECSYFGCLGLFTF